MNRREFFSHAKASFQDILEARFTIPGVIFDFVFFFLFGLLAIPIRDAMRQNLIYLGDEIIGQSATTEVSEIVFGSAHFYKILWLAIALAIIVYFLYCFVQSAVWRRCLKTSGSYWTYTKKFMKVNVLWYALFVVYMIVNFVLSYIDQVGERYQPGGIFYLGFLSNIILLVIIYFAFISYVYITQNTACKSIKKSIKYGIKKLKWFFLMYLLAIVLFIITNLILLLAQRMHTIVFMLVGIALVMPLMIWIRVFIGKITKAL